MCLQASITLWLTEYLIYEEKLTWHKVGVEC